jgi:hypothetical protein
LGAAVVFLPFPNDENASTDAIVAAVSRRETAENFMFFSLTIMMYL